jgi:peptidoglycan hydrolase-like protein with peptidoglycan-binding domain
MQIAAIRQAQKNLRLLGYYNGPIDGSPSPSLMASLRAWQTSAGFRPTGRFDENTLKGLSLMPN